MELLYRVLRESLGLAKKNPFWLGFAFLQGIAAVLFSASIKFFFYGKGNAWVLLVLADVLVSLSVVFMWPKIQKKHEEKQRSPLDAELKIHKQKSVLLVQSFGLCLLFSLLLLVIRLLVVPWSYAIFISSLLASFALGILLFSILFELSIKDSAQGSVDLWLKKTIFPVLVSFGLMLGNGLALMVAKTWFMSLMAGGFSELASFAKIWSLALVATLVVLFLIVWFNCLVVIAFMEIIKPSKKTNLEPTLEAALQPKLSE